MITYRSLTAERTESKSSGKATYFSDGRSLFAEELAMRTYQGEGYKCLWSENTFWWQVMALLFWDAIFSRVQGAVKIISEGEEIELEPEHPKYEELFRQTVLGTNGMPMDFYSSDLYGRRRMLIANRIKELKHSGLLDKLKISFERNFGKPCRCIENWDKYSLNDLLTPLQHIDPDCVIGMCERLLKSYASHRTGLPDLIIYSPNEFFFVEVKTENDKISANQADWHDFLSELLGLRVELFLMNHSERQIKSIQQKSTRTSFDITISIGYSTSKKREDAIKFIMSLPTCKTSGKGKETVYSAVFNTSEIRPLYKMLELTQGWKTQRIEINGEEVSSAALKNSLYCYRENAENRGCRTWCKESIYEGEKGNPFGCRAIWFGEFAEGIWLDYGYLDTEAGEWVFDLVKIQQNVEAQIYGLQFCPLFDGEQVRAVIKKIPARANPMTDHVWAFIAEDRCRWIWHENRWITDRPWSSKAFPGFGMMVGVERISKKQRNGFVKLQSNVSASDRSPNFDDGQGRKGCLSAGSCFIATCVYASPDAYQVAELRRFRDRKLIQSFLGRSFIRIYNLIGPQIVRFLDKYPSLKSPVRFVLDRIVSRIAKGTPPCR